MLFQQRVTKTLSQMSFKIGLSACIFIILQYFTRLCSLQSKRYISSLTQSKQRVTRTELKKSHRPLIQIIKMLQSQGQIHEQHRLNRPQRWTNNILLEHQPRKMTYYVPCYLRLKIKNIQSVNITRMQGQISCDMIFTVYYGPLPRYLVGYLKSGIILEFSRNNNIQLSEDTEIMTTNQNFDQKTLNFTIRTTCTTTIEGDLYLSPFQLLQMKLIVSIRSIVIEKAESEEGVQTILRFNLMDSWNSALKLSYGKNTTFQSYCLAPSHTYVCYTNHIIKQNESRQQSFYPENKQENYIQTFLQEIHQQKGQHRCEHQKIKHFQYAHFCIGIYKYPLASVATVYVPMWSMAFYNLFVFFQYLNDLGMKINNGTIILLTLFVYLPTIRSQIPEKPYLIVSQLLLLIICVTFLLNLISAVYFQQQTLSEDPNIRLYYQIDFWFYISVGLVGFTFVAVVLITIVHKLCWEPSYLREAEIGNPREKFSHRKWGNKHADSYFEKFDCISVIL